MFESANVDGSVSAISTLGLDGGLISIITTSGKNLSIRLTNSDDSDVDVTITSVGWINAHNDQKFKKVKNDAGSTLYDPDSAKASALTYPINVSFTLTGQSCLAPESSSSEGGDGGGDGSGEGDGDGDGSGSSGSEGDGDDSSSDSDESASTDTPIDPEAGVSSTNQSGGSSIEGRLSWREIVF